MVAVDGRRPKRGKVRRDELAIEQCEMTDAEPGDEPGQRHL